MKRTREQLLTDIRAWHDRHQCDRDLHAPAVATAYVGYLLGVIDGLIYGQERKAAESKAPFER